MHCHFKEPLDSNFSTLAVNPCFRLWQTIKLCLFLGQLIALSSYILMLSLSHSFCVFFLFVFSASTILQLDTHLRDAANCQLLHLHFLLHTFRLVTFNDNLPMLTTPHSTLGDDCELSSRNLNKRGSWVCELTACLSCRLPPVEDPLSCLASQLRLPFV